MKNNDTSKPQRLYAIVPTLDAIPPCIQDKHIIEDIHNLSDYEGTEEWYCSNCHIRLRNWVRLLPSKDDEFGTLDPYKYLFKFCPECGEKIDWEDNK